MTTEDIVEHAEQLEEGGTWPLDLVAADYLRRGIRPRITV